MIREDGLAQLLYDFFFFVFFCWEKELNLGQGWHKELKLKIRFSQVFSWNAMMIMINSILSPAHN